MSVQIASEADALDALDAVLAWARREPELTHGGPATGRTFQRGRVIATLTHDGTIGASTYLSAEDAAQKAVEMERAYLKWLALRDAQVSR